MAGSYYNVVEIESALQNLATSYSALCTRIPLPNLTAEGRASHALRISSGFGHPKNVIDDIHRFIDNYDPQARSVPPLATPKDSATSSADAR